jgi:NTP pyrophosphatase (non-canonical NTP hydrolase)
MTEKLIEFGNTELLYIEKELQKAKYRFPKKINSFHEAYGILLEEVEEFWDEVKKNEGEQNKQMLTLEILQVATVAIRIYQDLLKEDH